MTRYILGLIHGIFGVIVYFILFQPTLALPVNYGRFLDQDRIYLENGAILNGWILEERAKDFLFETLKGTVEIRFSECKKITRDVQLYYLIKIL